MLYKRTSVIYVKHNELTEKKNFFTMHFDINIRKKYTKAARIAFLG